MKINGKNVSAVALVLFSVLMATLLTVVATRQWAMYSEIKDNAAEVKHHQHSEIADESAR